MYTIKNHHQSEIIIKNSKFIALLFKIKERSDIPLLLNEVKTKYKDASHYCYAYKLDNYIKFSDDHEPKGTAGKPILEIILKKDLNKVLIIVVRYFGGIKLGASALLRAYNKVSSNVITKDNLIEDIKYILIQINIPYQKKKLVDSILAKETIKEIIYAQNIIYKANVSHETLQLLQIKKIDYKIL